MAHIILGASVVEQLLERSELYGPASYSSDDVAKAFSEVLDKQIKAQQIPRNQWEGTLGSIGFSKDGIRNFVEMTEAVISGKSKPQGNGAVNAETSTTLKEYLEQMVKNA